MSHIAYVRVSASDQKTDRQLDLLKDQAIDKLFEEKISGATAARPQLQAMLEYVRDGDVIVVESLSRLARSARDLLNIVEKATREKCRLKIPKRKV